MKLCHLFSIVTAVLKNSMTFYGKKFPFFFIFHDFSMTFAIFHDFPGLENGLPKFHDFP